MNNIMNDNKPKRKTIRLPIYNYFKKVEKNVSINGNDDLKKEFKKYLHIDHTTKIDTISNKGDKLSHIFEHVYSKNKFVNTYLENESDYQSSQSRQGSYNIVRNFTTKNSVKISERISKEPLFVFIPDKGIDKNKILDTYSNNKDIAGKYYITSNKIKEFLPNEVEVEVQPGVTNSLKEELFDQIEYIKDNIYNNIRHTKKNWTQASDLKIAPDVKFFGFYEKYAYNKSGTEILEIHLFPYMISEAYKKNINEFYKLDFMKNAKHTFTAVDNIVAKQINDKLKIMNTEMFVTCFDIKPDNTVINYEGDTIDNIKNIDVRLIDWDADFCIGYSGKFNIENNKNDIFKNLHILNKILMANHFFCYIHKNIFYKQMSQQKQNQELMSKQKQLEQLFCNIDITKSQDIFLSNYLNNSEWYFQKTLISQGHTPCIQTKEKTNVNNEKCKAIYNKMKLNSQKFSPSHDKPQEPTSEGGNKTKRKKYKRKRCKTRRK